MSKPTHKKTTLTDWLRASSIRVGQAYFWLAALYIAVIVIYDAFNVLTPESLRQRWAAASVLLVASAILWYLARYRDKSNGYYTGIIYSYIALAIGFASFNVFWQRGMASTSVILYIVPIAVAAVLLRKSALYLVAIASVAAYTFSAVSYFALYPSEGYKAQLYAEIGFYSGLFFVVAALLWSVIRSKNATLD